MGVIAIFFTSASVDCDLGISDPVVAFLSGSVGPTAQCAASPGDTEREVGRGGKTEIAEKGNQGTSYGGGGAILYEHMTSVTDISCVLHPPTRSPADRRAENLCSSALALLE